MRWSHDYTLCISLKIINNSHILIQMRISNHYCIFIRIWDTAANFANSIFLISEEQPHHVKDKERNLVSGGSVPSQFWVNSFSTRFRRIKTRTTQLLRYFLVVCFWIFNKLRNLDKCQPGSSFIFFYFSFHSCLLTHFKANILWIKNFVFHLFV